MSFSHIIVITLPGLELVYQIVIHKMKEMNTVSIYREKFMFLDSNVEIC